MNKILGILLFISLLLITSCTENTESITQDQLDMCEQNSDCIIVPHDHCCGSTKKAINKEYLDEYNSHPEWQKYEDPEVCAMMGVCPNDNHVNSAECVNNQCRMIY